ncbi:MAG: hypothetical protein HY791_15740 [Deltaproteobacteria bacterium]|nr:hypothetical protein [Deltaproteobacteria bacterium]
MSAKEIDALAIPLRAHYRRFLDRPDVLMTGHSHQAWPDVSREAQLSAWDDAARLVDEKWGRIFGELVPEFQRGVAKRIGSTRASDIAFAGNTHELVTRLLSCFGPRPAVLTTPFEFHSLSRQLTRAEESGAVVARVDPSEMPSRIGDNRYDLVALSMVFFETARVVDLDAILAAAAARGLPVLVDTYHAFNTIPFSADAWPGAVFVTGGGYKYAAGGEGGAFLLLPKDATAFRPENTGWMADFGGLAKRATRVSYGDGGFRFMGATFDPTGLYRAVAVFRFFDEQGLTVPTLRAQSVRQTERVIERFEDLKLASRGVELTSPRESKLRGAFVAFRCSEAQEVVGRMAEKGVHVDARRDTLRVGPAPYSTSAEIDRAMDVLAECL